MRAREQNLEAHLEEFICDFCLGFREGKLVDTMHFCDIVICVMSVISD